MGTYNRIKCKIKLVISKPEPQKDPHESNRKVPAKLGEWKGTATFASSVNNFNKAKFNLQEVEVVVSYLGMNVSGNAFLTTFNDTKRTLEFIGSGPLFWNNEN